jgi:hypothetical protein
MQVEFDPKQLLGKINELDKVQIPRAASIALNQSLFETRKKLQDEAKSIFNNPVPFTINSFLYQKPVQRGNDLEAMVFVRDDAPKGNAPSRYLDPQIRGGKHYRTRFQKALGNTPDLDPRGSGGPVLAPNRIMVPTSSQYVRRNRYGNMSTGQYTQILSALRNASSADLPSIRRSRGTRNVKNRYFYLNQETVEEMNLQNRSPGIFLQRGRSLYRIMTETKLPTYTGKFKFFDIAAMSITNEFSKRFRDNILR